MINQQLVDYIKQQMQAGVSREAVRKALSDAGWPPADVDDSLKAAEPAGGMSANAATPQTINPVVAMGGIESAGVSGAASSSGDKFFSRPAISAQASPAEDDDDEEHPSAKKFMIAMIAMGVVILLLAGALIFVYFNLNGQLSAAQRGAGGDPAQLTSLQQQVSQLSAEKNSLATQVQALDSENNQYASELGFFMPATGTSTAPMTATVRGTLSGNATTTFTLTTAHNVRVLVANSKDAKVAAALAPLAGGASPVTLSGTHTAGSTNLTVTSVNGAPL